MSITLHNLLSDFEENPIKNLLTLYVYTTRIQLVDFVPRPIQGINIGLNNNV